MRERNWSKYNKDLVQRGSLTFLIDPKSFKNLNPKNLKRKVGRPIEYSTPLIELLALIKTHFRLGYRALEGFAKSFLHFFIKGVKVPTYSLICKRLASLKKVLPKLYKGKKSLTIIVDATGMKVVGEGEWKVKIHGRGRPRKWVKVHIAIDAATQQIIGESTTESNIGDSSALKGLLEQIPGRIKQVIGDGGYDRKTARKAIKDRGANPLVPPPRNARYRNSNDERDRAILEIAGLGNDRKARSLWGKLTGYNYRVLVETAISRLKRVFGDRFYSKTIERQCVENHLRCIILNKMRGVDA